MNKDDNKELSDRINAADEMVDKFISTKTDAVGSENTATTNKKVYCNNEGIFYKPFSELEPDDLSDAQKEIIDNLKLIIPKQVSDFVTGFMEGTGLRDKLMVGVRNKNGTIQTSQDKEFDSNKRGQSKGTTTISKNGNTIRLHIHGSSIRNSGRKRK
jgi:hypothetical protein